MLSITFTRHYYSNNNTVSVSEFEIERTFDGLNKYRITTRILTNSSEYLIESKNKKDNNWTEIVQSCDLSIVSDCIESILPRNPDTGDIFVTTTEFTIAWVFWREGRKHAQEEIERENEQKEKEE